MYTPPFWGIINPNMKNTILTLARLAALAEVVERTEKNELFQRDLVSVFGFDVGTDCLDAVLRVL